MSLKLYFLPLASFCHKALIALYENGTPFEPAVVDLGDEASRAARSFARVLAEAEPYFGLFPMDRKPRIARQ